MASLADMDAGKPLRGGAAQFIDRWIYVFMAGLFLVAIFAGFIPDSLAKVAAVKAGQRAPFPMVLHAHAVLMGAWMLLLLAQTTLMATGRQTLHKQLGIASFVLAPALVIVGFLLVPTMHYQLADAIRNSPPQVAAAIRPALGIVLDIMLIQIRVGIVFAVLIGIAIAVRRSDSGLHKRLMILGTAAALSAATDRISWLPSTMPHSPLTADLWPLVLIAPMFLWDLYRLKRVHSAYVIYLLLCLALAIPMNLLWNTPWWRDTAMQMTGIAGV